MKKTLHNGIIFLLCFIIYLSSYNVPVKAAVINQVASITPVKQAESFLCWAACAVMYGKNLNPSSDKTQEKVVEHIKGEYGNYTANDAECIDACRYVSDQKRLYYGAAKYSFMDVSQRFAKGEGIYTFLTMKGKNVDHIVVMCGSQFIDDHEGSRYYIDYIDPWDASRHHCLYEKFCDGTYNNYIVRLMLVSDLIDS